jgi:hypothetical protein
MRIDPPLPPPALYELLPPFEEMVPFMIMFVALIAITPPPLPPTTGFTFDEPPALPLSVGYSTLPYATPCWVPMMVHPFPPYPAPAVFVPPPRPDPVPLVAATPTNPPLLTENTEVASRARLFDMMVIVYPVQVDPKNAVLELVRVKNVDKVAVVEETVMSCKTLKVMFVAIVTVLESKLQYVIFTEFVNERVDPTATKLENPSCPSEFCIHPPHANVVPVEMVKLERPYNHPWKDKKDAPVGAWSVSGRYAAPPEYTVMEITKLGPIVVA